MKVLCSEGIANHTGPESCVMHREVYGEALTGESVGQPLSRESFKLVQGADAVSVVEGNTDGHAFASARTACVVLDPGMQIGSLRGNREISSLTDPFITGRSASGRRGVEADDARAGEVRPFHSSDEAEEQIGVFGTIGRKLLSGISICGIA